MLTDECKRNISVAFDCSLVDLSHPPVLQKYDSIGELLYVNAKNVWTACGNCRKGPVDLYNTSDPNNGQLYVPDALKDLVSPYEKGQIALAGLISKSVKPRCDTFKVWEHIQGQIRTRGRLDYHYFGMYGFMVAKDKEQVLDKGQESVSEIQLRIKRELFWLQGNNPLSSNFYANYDTLYRFDPEKVLHLYKATQFDANYHTTVDTHL